MSPAAMRPWAILTLIFLLGAATGSLLTIGLGPRFEPPAPNPQDMGRHWMMYLTRQLHLTDDQQAKIRPVIMEAEKQIDSVHRTDVGQISAILGDANAKIASVLNPDQQAELKKMDEERRQRFLHHLHGHGRPGPHDFHGPGPHDQDHPPGPPPGDTNAPPVPTS